MNTLKKMAKYFSILFQYSWKVHFISFTDVLHRNALMWSNNRIMQYKKVFFLFFWNYKSNLSIEVKKIGFRDETIQKAAKVKDKPSSKKIPERLDPRTIDPGQTFCDIPTHLHLFYCIFHAIIINKCNFFLV